MRAVRAYYVCAERRVLRRLRADKNFGLLRMYRMRRTAAKVSDTAYSSSS